MPDIIDHLVKTVLIGAPEAGKTALANSLAKIFPFTSRYNPSRQVNYTRITSSVIDGNQAAMQLWDIPGSVLTSEDSNDLGKYLIGTNAIWICIDPHNRKTFDGIDWEAVLSNISPVEGKPKPDVYLVLTHSDKTTLSTPANVTAREIDGFRNYLRSNKNINFCETLNVSARTGENVQDLFDNTWTKPLNIVKQPLNIVKSEDQSRINLIKYLNYELGRSDLKGTPKYTAFTDLLSRASSNTNTESTEKLIAETKEVAAQHRPTINPARMLNNLVRSPTSYQDFKQMVENKPSAPSPSAGPKAGPR